MTKDTKHSHNDLPIFQDETIADLKRDISDARKLAETKSNFLAMISHEIRTPLQTIYGLLELIAEERPEKNISDMVNTAQKSAGELLEILDDVLDMVKMDSDKLSLDVFEVPVRLLVNGIIEALSSRVDNDKLQLITEIEQNVPAVIIGDPKRLRQILMNLCTNAVKFTKQGIVKIKVSTDTKKLTLAEGNIGLRFEVIDTGIGISSNLQSCLFQPFTQADNSISRKYGGTGIGLSICKKLVDMMGGKIGVISEEGAGSTFWFEIPTREVSTKIDPVSLPNLEGISVLSVDSHPQGSKEIANSLSSMGAKIESCATYEEGLDLARKIPFDVAVIDQNLPDGLGIHLIQELSLLRPFMGLVMYTVHDDKELLQTLRSLGATHLTKPASRIGLGRAVKKAANVRIKKVKTQPHESSAKILIAEDTSSIRDILRRQCEKLGIDATFAVGGQEALDLLADKNHHFDMLITDLHMPVIDGYMIVEQIRKAEKDNNKDNNNENYANGASATKSATNGHMPIIMLTADVQMSGRESYLEHGFDECMIKPVSIGQLKQLLIRWNLLDESKIKNFSSVIGSRKALYHTSMSQPAVDKNCIISQMGDFDDNALDMLLSFLDLTDPLITKIAAAEGQKDYKTLGESAHSLKGAARSACCNILGQIAEQIQTCAQKEESCTNLVVAMVKEFERVRGEVKSLNKAKGKG